MEKSKDDDNTGDDFCEKYNTNFNKQIADAEKRAISLKRVIESEKTPLKAKEAAKAKLKIVLSQKKRLDENLDTVAKIKGMKGYLTRINNELYKMTEAERPGTSNAPIKKEDKPVPSVDYKTNSKISESKLEREEKHKQIPEKIHQWWLSDYHPFVAAAIKTKRKRKRKRKQSKTRRQQKK